MIKQELKIKAFDIVKRKGVAVGMIQLLEEHGGGFAEYNDFIGGDKKLHLTEKEYNFLRKVFKKIK